MKRCRPLVRFRASFGLVVAGLAAFSITRPVAAEMSATERARRDVAVATVGSTIIHVGDLEDKLALMPGFQRDLYGSTEAEVRRGVLERVLVRDALLAGSIERERTDPLVHYEVARARSNATMRHLASNTTEPQNIPPAEVAAYYEAHTASYHVPMRIQVWRILVATAPEAEGVLAAMREAGTPENWGKLCRDKSLDEATKLRRGSLGFIAPDGTSSEAGVKAPAELYQAALTASDGELVSKPVPEGSNFAVVWRRGTTPAKMQTLEAATPEIRRTLYDTAFRTAREQLIAKLRAAHVEKLDEAPLATLVLDPAAGLEPVAGKARAAAPKNSR